jgi:TonB family protein
MVNRHLPMLAWWLMLLPFVTVSLSCLGSERSSTERAPLLTRERLLRQRVVVSDKPIYPSSSISAGAEGVAVSSVLVGADGLVQNVEILESPDRAIEEAVRKALEAWVFRAPESSGESGPRRMQGKITFYFRIEGGCGRVLSPDEASLASMTWIHPGR